MVFIALNFVPFYDMKTYLFSILLLYILAVFDDSVEFYVDIAMAFNVVLAFEVVT